MVFPLAREEDTLCLAAAWARAKACGQGAVVCLRGPLGSGKTVFVRGFLRGLGHRGAVRSPTFGLIHEYRRLRPMVLHLDLYRLKPLEAERLGLRELLRQKGAVFLIEWPEAAERLLPKDRLELVFAHSAQGGRALRARGLGPLSRLCAGALRAKASLRDGGKRE